MKKPNCDRFTRGELQAMLAAMDTMTREANAVDYECNVDDKASFRSARQKLEEQKRLLGD